MQCQLQYFPIFHTFGAIFLLSKIRVCVTDSFSFLPNDLLLQTPQHPEKLSCGSHQTLEVKGTLYLLQ